MNQSLILSIGEAMVELSEAGKDGLWRLGIAGDTLNTAWYLRRLMPETTEIGYFTRVGLGKFSEKMIAFLEAEGIATGFISRDDRREIGLYAIALEDGERSFSYWRSDSAAKGLADNPQALDAALAKTGLAYFSGITLGILSDQGRSNLMEAVAKARRNGTQVVFDPNLRPGLWSSNQIMCAAIEAAAAISDVIMPSFDDEQQFFGDASPQDTIARYLGKGAAQVIVKAGGAPVHFGGAQGEGIVSDLQRQVPVDTTAAGDSFNAGYLAARLDGAGIADAIRSAHSVSLAVIGQRGALVDIG